MDLKLFLFSCDDLFHTKWTERLTRFPNTCSAKLKCLILKKDSTYMKSVPIHLILLMNIKTPSSRFSTVISIGHPSI